MNQAALKVLFDTLQLLLKLYVDLNCQDIPEFFEDNMTPFMAIFHKYLTYNNPLLATDVLLSHPSTHVRMMREPDLWRKQKPTSVRLSKSIPRNTKMYSLCFQILSIRLGRFSLLRG